MNRRTWLKALVAAPAALLSVAQANPFRRLRLIPDHSWIDLGTHGTAIVPEGSRQRFSRHFTVEGPAEVWGLGEGWISVSYSKRYQTLIYWLNPKTKDYEEHAAIGNQRAAKRWYDRCLENGIQTHNERGEDRRIGRSMLSIHSTDFQ
jgi:hypothetical protein